MQVVSRLIPRWLPFIEHKPNHLHASPAIPWLPGGPNPSCRLSAGPSVGQIRGFYPGDFLTPMPAADNAEDGLPHAVHVHVFCCQGPQLLKQFLSLPPPPHGGKPLQIYKAVLTYSPSSWQRSNCVNCWFSLSLWLL